MTANRPSRLLDGGLTPAGALSFFLLCVYALFRSLIFLLCALMHLFLFLWCFLSHFLLFSFDRFFCRLFSIFVFSFGVVVLTLKAMSHVGRIRSDLALLRRSRNVSSASIAECEASSLSYLAQKSLIYPPAFRDLGLGEDMSYQDRKKAVGIKSFSVAPSAAEIDFQDQLETAGREARKCNWVWRIGAEMTSMRDRGWFPFFVTLTVDPSRVADSMSFWKEGREFRRYIRRLAEVSARACGKATALKDGASDADFIRHCGVIEHGASRQHHHMHLMVWMRDVPSDWKICPNRGNPNPSTRTTAHCRQMGTYWPWALPGLGRAIYFRHEGDVWGALGFCLPISRKTGRPSKVYPPASAGVYVAKYMEKEDRAWLHRVKATRNLGKDYLRALLERLPLQSVRALTWRARTYSLNVFLQTIHSVPHGLLRSMAKQVLFCRQWASDTLDLKACLQPSIAVYSAMLQSVRNGARPREMLSAQFFDWVTEHLPVPDGYSERALQRAHLRCSVEFPPLRPAAVRHLGGLPRA